jgi:hypothetical protein
MARGGARIGAGRKKTDTVPYHRRIKPEWVEVLDKTLEELKGNKNMKNNWFVANDNGDVAGHDLSKERAEALAEQMQKEEPEANWEALSSDED